MPSLPESVHAGSSLTVQLSGTGAPAPAVVPAARRRYWTRLAPLLALLAVTVHLPAFRRTVWNPDEGFVAVQARLLAHGGRLYDTVIDRKPPLLPWLYQGSFALFGDGSLWPPRAVAVVAHVLTAVLLASIARRRWGDRYGAAAGVAYVLLSIGLAPEDTQAANFEVLMLPWTAAAFWCADRSRWGAAGLAVAGAALTKQSGAVMVLPVAWMLWRAGKAPGKPGGEAPEPPPGASPPGSSLGSSLGSLRGPSRGSLRDLGRGRVRDFGPGVLRGRGRGFPRGSGRGPWRGFGRGCLRRFGVRGPRPGSRAGRWERFAAGPRPGSAAARRRGLRPAFAPARLFAGVVAPPTVVALGFGAKRFLFWTVTGSSAYVSPDGAGLTAVGRALGNAGILAAAGAGLVAPGVWLAVRRRGFVAADVLVWLIASAVAVTAGFQFYGHYYLQLLPPLVLAGTAALHKLPHWWKPAAGWTVLASGAFLAWGFAAPRTELEHAATVAAAVREHTGPDDTVLVWGMHPEQYWLARRTPASRYLTAGFLTNFSGGRGGARVGEKYAVPGAWRTFQRELAARAPALVVDDSRGAPYAPRRVPTLRRLLAEHYQRVGMAGGAVLYVLKDARGEPHADPPRPPHAP